MPIYLRILNKAKRAQESRLRSRKTPKRPRDTVPEAFNLNIDLRKLELSNIHRVPGSVAGRFSSSARKIIDHLESRNTTDLRNTNSAQRI